MAGVTIVFKDGSTLALDATMAQDHERSASVTDHPLEDGSSVSDHISVNPYRLSINAVQSYAPIVRPGESPEPNRHVAAFLRLERAVDERELVKVQTGLKVYENMAFETMTVRKDGSSGFDVPLQISFKQVKYAIAKTAAVPKDAIGKPKPNATKVEAAKQVQDTQAQTAKPKPKGKVPKKPPTPPQEARAKSLLNMVFGKLGG